MRLRLLAVGKLKQAGLEALVQDYQKRSRALLPVETLWLRDMPALRAKSPAPGKPGQGPRRRVVLDERGEQIDSETLARWLGTWRDGAVREVDFLIGDAHGFTPVDRGGADKVLALSKLTLPHRLAQVMLVEQLYRAGTILAGHPYHHR